MKNRFKQLRNKLDMTQAQVAEKIGIDRGTWAKYESGENAPRISMIRAVCREFNVNEEWLRTGKGEMFVEKIRDEEIAEFVEKAQFENGFKKRFIAMLSELTESDWEVLEKMALSLYSKNEEGE